MEIRFERWPSWRIAYIRRRGPYGAGNIQTMEALKGWARAHKLLHHSTAILGIAQDNPDITPPEHCRYDAGIILPDADSDEGRLLSKEIPMPWDDHIHQGKLAEGEYLVCKIKHTAEHIEQAWKRIFQAMEHHGYRMDHKPVIERYSEDLVSEGYCELCVPVTG
ncbi:GyrI-like domain-containing protein [Paenibacillus sp. 7541]|uniref:AraC family transcriptional regulator n=1 Tax=Paenibacillus sp. 7541 TaxID=2026236 RepID=UPI000BA5742A|nr:GyrI-like domain-containing protein [Paenibacillus sp. 7541]PAK51426.1 hypothetical protein CHH75_14625 [Paenibacillus sp. 7541]